MTDIFDAHGQGDDLRVLECRAREHLRDAIVDYIKLVPNVGREAVEKAIQDMVEECWDESEEGYFTEDEKRQ